MNDRRNHTFIIMLTTTPCHIATFQAMMLEMLGFENCKNLLLDGTEIKCKDSVKLLGVTVDYMLNFDKHNPNICKKLQGKLMFCCVSVNICLLRLRF